MRRREFITLLGTAATWPLAARAQQPSMPRIGVLLSLTADDPEGKVRLKAGLQGLQEVGLNDGSNVKIDVRWGGAQANIRRSAAELVALSPNVILVIGGSAVGPVLQETQTIPIVFTQTTDPVGAGYVASLSQPGGNATGFITTEYSMSAKLLEVLKQLAPSVTRAAVLRDPGVATGIGAFGAVQSAAPSFSVELNAIDARDAGEIDRAITAFARNPNGGLIVLPGAAVTGHRDLIITLAARYRLPAIYPFRYYAAGGGLVSYGPSTTEPLRRAAAYVDRILKGEKPSDLPVQTPTKYELVINLKTAKALGLTIPQSILATADEVIE